MLKSLGENIYSCSFSKKTTWGLSALCGKSCIGLAINNGFGKESVILLQRKLQGGMLN